MKDEITSGQQLLNEQYFLYGGRWPAYHKLYFCLFGGKQLQDKYT